ncbi:MAG TPA: purine-nucleoside phosphorylase [Thermoanaerobaculia bacterium]|nr:purine-nucleoside phosphorylase [Thermoanaerobaculia bacterium]
MSSSDILRRLDAAVEAIRKESRSQAPPVVGVVLGSGLGAFADRLSERASIPYGRIPNFPASTGVVGHAGELVLGRVGKAAVAVLSGRVHFYEGHSMTDVVFPARVLARLGVKAVVLTNAAGGVRLTYRPGDLMLIADHINFFGHHPLIGPNEEALGPRFPDMSTVYDAALRKVVKAVARAQKIPLKEGVYLGNSGPSYETPAEIRAFRKLGADAVGMSTVPEALALRHAGVRVAGISTITNMAAGILKQPLVHTEVLETTRRVSERFVRLLAAAVPKIADAVA